MTLITLRSERGRLNQAYNVFRTIRTYLWHTKSVKLAWLRGKEQRVVRRTLFETQKCEIVSPVRNLKMINLPHPGAFMHTSSACPRGLPSWAYKGEMPGNTRGLMGSSSLGRGKFKGLFWNQ